jgi:tRNA nucleotidyltransferase (CCA-adding enzyme)
MYDIMKEVIYMDIEKIKQDPLLIFSLILEYAENNLEVDPNIKQTIIENKGLIRQVKPEHLYEEFKRFMETENPAKYIREFKEVFFEFIPGLAKTFGFEQNNPWHIYDVFEHTMHVIENTPPIGSLRIAALFHDLGKPNVYKEETKTREDGSTYQVGHFWTC